MKLYRILLGIIIIQIIAVPLPAVAALTPMNAFTLIKKIPPGLQLKDADRFLGSYHSEKSANEAGTMKIRRWEFKNSWALDILHDTSMVRAAKVMWLTTAKGEQARIFAGLTHQGRKEFGKFADFYGHNEARWSELENHWIIIAKLDKIGVSLVSGIRDKLKDSGRYGF